MTSFRPINICFSGRVNLKQIEEKTAQEDPGACSPGNFLRFYMVMVSSNGFFSAF